MVHFLRRLQVLILTMEQAQAEEIAFRRWEEIKQKEKKDDTLSVTLDRVARTLPSLMRSQKLLKKAGKAGFEESGRQCSPEELIARYKALCLDANASDIDLEELGYAFNEDYVKEKSKEEQIKKEKEKTQENR